MTAWLAGVAAASAVLLLGPWRVRLPGHVAVTARGPAGSTRSASWRRALWCLLAGLGGAWFVGGAAAPVVGAVTGGAAWWLLARSEPAGVRRAREEARRDLPHLVHLLGAALRAGAAPAEAVRLVCAALPGAAAARLAGVHERLSLGVDPGLVWASLATDDALAPLGRSLARAHETGAPVVDTVDRLADELERDRRAAVEDRARAVGVRAALPLGLCLLPSFLLLGIVPLVAGLLGGLAP